MVVFIIRRMNLKSDDISTWVDSLKDFQPEYLAIKVSSVLSFFRMRGKTSNMVASNMEVIPDVHYALYDPHAKKYYFREYRGYDLDTVFFYRSTLTF